MGVSGVLADGSSPGSYFPPITSAGCDRVTVSFAVEDVDFSLGPDDTSPWRSDDGGADLGWLWTDLGEDEDSAEDDSFEDSSGSMDVRYAMPPTGCWRDVSVGGAQVHVAVYERVDLQVSIGDDHDGFPERVEPGRGRRWWATVSFNPSRLHDPSGWRVCPAAEAQTWTLAVVVHLARTGVVVPACEHIDGLTSRAYAVIERHWSPRTGELVRVHSRPLKRSWCQDAECLLDLIYVSRLDATVDVLEVRDTELWVDVFAGHRQERAGWTKKRHSPFSASAQRGKRGLRVAIYDKHVESSRPGRPKSAVAPVGTLRVEVMARSARLQKVMSQDRSTVHLVKGEPVAASSSSRRLRFLMPELLVVVFDQGFVWAGLDRWIGGEHPLTPDHESLTPLTARRLKGFLDARAGGRARNEVVNNTTRKYEALAALYGYIVGVPRAKGTGPVRHLNVVQELETKPSVEWRLARGLIHLNSGAARTLAPRRRRSQ